MSGWTDRQIDGLRDGRIPVAALAGLIRQYLRLVAET